jgi:hypothetical protein
MERRERCTRRSAYGVGRVGVRRSDKDLWLEGGVRRRDALRPRLEIRSGSDPPGNEVIGIAHERGDKQGVCVV